MNTVIGQKILNNKKLTVPEIITFLPYANEFMITRLISQYDPIVIKYIVNPSFRLCYFAVKKDPYMFNYIPYKYKSRMDLILKMN